MTRGKMIPEEMLAEKKEIPTKSRIAGWWMLIVGSIAVAVIFLGVIIFLPFLVWGMIDQNMVIDDGGTRPVSVLFVFVPLGIAIFICCFLPSLLVLKGGRLGWIIASAILTIAIFGSLIRGGFWGNPLSMFPLLIPLTLILLDHISSRRAALIFLIFVAITYVSSLIIADILI
jgi:hypothetical protein